MSASIAQNVLWFNISVADALSVNVSNRPHKLIRVQLDYKIGDHLFHFEVLFHYSVCGIRNVVHHDVEVNLIWLVSICVEALSHFDAIRMMKHLKNRKLPILISLILEYFLDGNSLCSFCNGCLKYHTK